MLTTDVISQLAQLAMQLEVKMEVWSTREVLVLTLLAQELWTVIGQS